MATGMSNRTSVEDLVPSSISSVAVPCRSRRRRRYPPESRVRRRRLRCAGKAIRGVDQPVSLCVGGDPAYVVRPGETRWLHADRGHRRYGHHFADHGRTQRQERADHPSGPGRPDRPDFSSDSGVCSAEVDGQSGTVTIVGGNINCAFAQSMIAQRDGAIGYFNGPNGQPWACGSGDILADYECYSTGGPERFRWEAN